MARSHQRSEECARAHSDAAACIMERDAAGAGLTWPLRPWDRRLLEGVSSTPTLFMAPMAGVSDAAYRLMARAGGAQLAYTEMVSVAGIHYGSDKTWELVDPNPAEPEIAVQLFGAEPEYFREAAARVRERLGARLALIDVNMACPVPKVTKSGAGSALLDNPDGATEIIRVLKAEVDVPVTAKIRIGRVQMRIVGASFAQTLEQAGVSALAVHGRTASQLYRGSSADEEIQRVVQAVSIPVIASGDAAGPARIATMLATTGAAGCFVARGTYGNPWIFDEAQRVCAGGEAQAPTTAMKLAAFRLHIRLLEATGGRMVRARSLSGWYLRRVPHAAAWRERAMKCESGEDYLALADELDAYLASYDASSEDDGIVA